MRKIVEIFGKDFCPYCDKAVNLAKTLDVDFEYNKLDRDFTRDELFEQFPGARTFPQIRVKENMIDDGMIIGGYTEFESWSKTL